MKICVWVVTVLLLSACSRFEPHPDWVQAPSQEALAATLSGEALLGRPVQVDELPEVDLFELTPAMKAMAEELASIHHSPHARAQALHRALLGSPMQGGMGIQYSAYVTGTAAEAFMDREVNCLSFTALYVAMARHMGLNARVNDVKLPPNWDLRDDGSVTVFRHVNAKVMVRGRDTLVVDLEMGQYSPAYQQELISDQRAEAQFYNNRAMELLSAGELEPSFLHLRKAVQLDPAASYAWNNLGNLYHRQQLYPEAEAAFLEGLRLEPDNLSLISNLNHLYQRMGEVAKADYFEQRAREYREGNPYYLYALAREALEKGDANGAYEFIQRSLKKEGEEPRFYRLAERIYQSQGHGDKAAAMAERARASEQQMFL
ncbi:tetratricopeptide repeat protein [Marinimicrobium sp. ABcell2]|uniref:tetratricopeptide repeat protein n=1 Tax=Marinimicrobium sp. ABcell2 TaxID=3069751 RepID=UPI0027B28E56|nr:tetratricopeptide repeat protein [Marinimicrobium sp. ABcell2]MDQ2075729.1 tetratricopeptide repeat protein [Marinimicrobium sp. ABcell2]